MAGINLIMDTPGPGSPSVARHADRTLDRI